MRNRASILSLVLLGLMLLSPSVARSEWVLADMVMASVNHVAVTRNQVIQETRIVLAEKKLDWSVRLTPELLESVLERMIAKELIYQELERVSYREGEDDLIDGEALITAFGRNFAAAGEYETFIDAIGLSRRSFVALMIRNARIERFIDRRMSLMSRVSDEELRRAMNRPGVERESESARTERAAYTRQELERQKYNQAFSRWMEDLQGRNSVHRLARFTESVAPLVVDYGN